MQKKDTLVVLDFDGFLVNSYGLLHATFRHFGLDIGDEERFRHRRKFLKYLGGGKEFIRNFVAYSLPKKEKIRNRLTEIYQKEGRIYPPFVPLINRMIKSPDIHVGVISRNFTLNPGRTIRTVLRNSLVDEHDLDFVIPIPVGAKKYDVLEGMKSHRYRQCIFGADEISDYNAAVDTGYNKILMAGYGFDNRQRLVSQGEIPPDIIFDTPDELALQLSGLIGRSKSGSRHLAVHA
jgi:phosphoglycolate phosphatase